MATTLSTDILQETLQAEYPFLDTSLLAALIAELPPDNSISDEALDQLRGTLHVLSLHAEQDDSELRAQLECGHASSSRLESDAILDREISGTSDSLSSFTSATSTSSIPAGVSNHQISTAQGFFHVLFPHLPPSLIEKTLRGQRGLDSHDDTFNEDEMHTIVDHLLNLEYIQDLTERGIEELSDTQADVEEPWKLMTHKKNHIKSTKRPPRHTVALIDIRQRQHIAHQSNINKTARVIRPQLFLDDPWTRLRSLATRASDLLPSTRPEYFMSYFHTPTSELPNVRAGWKAEADALRQALTDLVARYPSKLDKVQLASSSGTLSSVLLPSEDETLDPEHKHRVQEDIRLCLAATKGDGDAALDLVWLLCELEEAFETGDGIAHTLPLSKSARPSLDSGSVELPPAAPPPAHTHPPLASPTRSTGTGHDGWTLVKPKKSSNKDVHPHAAFIPAYSNRSPDKKRHGDAAQLTRELNTLRAEAIREASRHWQAGNNRNHGGEVAIFYAERAREIQEEQRRWALEVARWTVAEKRAQSGERDTLDLHGLTVSEATAIVRETLRELSPARSLKVITGRGHHSAGQVGVLGPAVRDMLLKEGYHVSQWDAGLVVQGKR